MIPLSPVPFWQNFDIITLRVLFVVITILVLSQRKRTGTIMGTISQSVAHSKRSSLAFSVIMTLCFPLYYMFIWQWVGPLVGAPAYFYYVLGFAALAEMIFVWVPATTGKSRKIHEAAAYTVGIAMYVLSMTIYAYDHVLGVAAKLSLMITLLVPFIFLALMTFKKMRTYTFLYETIYVIAWLFSISLIAHS